MSLLRPELKNPRPCVRKFNLCCRRDISIGGRRGQWWRTWCQIPWALANESLAPQGPQGWPSGCPIPCGHIQFHRTTQGPVVAQWVMEPLGVGQTGWCAAGLVHWVPRLLRALDHNPRLSWWAPWPDTCAESTVGNSGRIPCSLLRKQVRGTLVGWGWGADWVGGTWVPGGGLLMSVWGTLVVGAP